MTERAWELQDVRGALERRGYQRIAAGTGDERLWYRAPHSVPEAIQYLVLRLKPQSESYGVRVGFLNDRVRLLRNRAVAYLRTLPRSTGCDSLCREDVPAWTLFDAGRALRQGGFPGWETLKIPNPADRTLGYRQFENLCEKFLAPLSDNVTTESLILERLLRTDVPFDWPASNPILRATEALSIASVTGEVDSACGLLLERQKLLPIGLRTGDTWKSTLIRLRALVV
jgi:hypothetical protein